MMRPAVFAEEDSVKPAALNSHPPLRHWIYQLHYIEVYNIMLYNTDGCTVLSEWEWNAQLQK